MSLRRSLATGLLPLVLLHRSSELFLLAVVVAPVIVVVVIVVVVASVSLLLFSSPTPPTPRIRFVVLALRFPTPDPIAPFPPMPPPPPPPLPLPLLNAVGVDGVVFSFVSIFTGGRSMSSFGSKYVLYINSAIWLSDLLCSAN